MSRTVLSQPSVEVHPARCRSHDDPALWRETVQRDGSKLIVCAHCGSYLSFDQFGDRNGNTNWKNKQTTDH